MERSYAEEQSAKWSFSTYSHGLVDALSVISHLNARRIKGVVWQERVSEGWGCEASVEFLGEMTNEIHINIFLHVCIDNIAM